MARGAAAAPPASCSSDAPHAGPERNRPARRRAGRQPAMKDLYGRIRDQVRPVVVGQDEPLAQILLAVACRGHVLIEGPPGVAKTLLARTLAKALGLDFAR